MRFFVGIKNGQVVGKHCLSGDNEKINNIVSRFSETYPNVSISEVNESEFLTTIVPQQQTQVQKDWATFKATSPTPQQAILYMAKFLGLE